MGDLQWLLPFFFSLPSTLWLDHRKDSWRSSNHCERVTVKVYAKDDGSRKEHGPRSLWPCGIAIPDLDLPLDFLLCENSKLLFCWINHFSWVSVYLEIKILSNKIILRWYRSLFINNIMLFIYNIQIISDKMLFMPTFNY